MDELELFDVIGQLYLAASNPEHWMLALHSVGRITGARRITIAAQDVQSGAGQLESVVEWNAAEMPAGSEAPAEDPALREAILRLAASTATESRQSFVANGGAPENRDDLLLLKDPENEIGVTVQRDKAYVTALVCYRPLSIGPYSEEETIIVRRLVPHVLRAARLRRQIVKLETERRATTLWLDRLRVAAILADRDSHIVAMNDAARALLAAKDGLVAAGPMLAAQTVSEFTKLQELIKLAASGATAEAHRRETGLRVSRPSKRRPYHLLVSPMQPWEPLPREQCCLASILIWDPELTPQVSLPLLQQLFGLSRSEHRVAVGLLDGKSIAEIASEHKLSQATVRYQLRGIFAKTETSRQAELMKLLIRLPHAG